MYISWYTYTPANNMGRIALINGHTKLDYSVININHRHVTDINYQ